MLQLLTNEIAFVSVVWVSYLELRKGLLNNSFCVFAVCLLCVCRLGVSFCVSSGSITAIIARVICRQCYTAECVCESLSLVSQDFNSNRGMTL